MSKRLSDPISPSQNKEKQQKVEDEQRSKGNVPLRQLVHQPNIPPTPHETLKEWALKFWVPKEAVPVYPVMLGITTEYELTAYTNNLLKRMVALIKDDYPKKNNRVYTDEQWLKDKKFLEKMMVEYFPVSFLGLRYCARTESSSSPFVCPLCHNLFRDLTIMDITAGVDKEYHPSRKATSRVINEWFNSKQHPPDLTRKQSPRGTHQDDNKRRRWTTSHGTFVEMVTHCESVEAIDPNDHGHYLMRLYLLLLQSQVFDSDWLSAAYQERTFYDSNLPTVHFHGAANQFQLTLQDDPTTSTTTTNVIEQEATNDPNEALKAKIAALRAQHAKANGNSSAVSALETTLNSFTPVDSRTTPDESMTN